jgi:hypothetical protein
MEVLVRTNPTMRGMLVAAHFVFAASAVACPICNTGTGDQVRAGILDENLGSTLLAVLLPFPILLSLVALIHVGWPSRRSADRRHSSD